MSPTSAAAGGLFDLFYDPLAPECFRMAMRLSGDTRRAAEITTEVLARAWLARDQGEAAIGREAVLRAIGIACGADSDLHAAGLRGRFSFLSEGEREVLVLVGVLKWSAEDAAAICGKPVATIRALLRQALLELSRASGP